MKRENKIKSTVNDLDILLGYLCSRELSRLVPNSNFRGQLHKSTDYNSQILLWTLNSDLELDYNLAGEKTKRHRPST